MMLNALLDAQWRTSCPACEEKDCLLVVEVTLFDGVVFEPWTRLHADGFEVGAWEWNDKYAKNESTDEEKIKCEKCGARFSLGNLSLSSDLTANPPELQSTAG